LGEDNRGGKISDALATNPKVRKSEKAISNQRRNLLPVLGWSPSFLVGKKGNRVDSSNT